MLVFEVLLDRIVGQVSLRWPIDSSYTFGWPGSLPVVSTHLGIFAYVHAVFCILKCVDTTGEFEFLEKQGPLFRSGRVDILQLSVYGILIGQVQSL